MPEVVPLTAEFRLPAGGCYLLEDGRDGVYSKATGVLYCIILYCLYRCIYGKVEDNEVEEFDSRRRLNETWYLGLAVYWKADCRFPDHFSFQWCGFESVSWWLTVSDMLETEYFINSILVILIVYLLYRYGTIYTYIITTSVFLINILKFDGYEHISPYAVFKITSSGSNFERMFMR